MKDSWIIAIVTVIVLFFMVVLFSPYQERTLSGANDFVVFYSGGRLLDGGDLYERHRLQEQATQAIGTFSSEHGYIRLPFHAALLWPLSRLPYLWAYAVWELAALAAFVAFILLWHPPGGQLNVLFAAMSVPAFTSIANGQDTTFLVLLIAGSVALYRRDRKGWAGAVCSLLAIKIHLFLPLPVWIVARREWRFAKGLLAGGGVLAAVSFLAAGWGWPLKFLASVLNPEFSPRTTEMANLHAVLTLLGGGFVWEAGIAVTIVAAVWIVSARMSFDYAFAIMLTSGFLLSIHAYLPDLLITLPAALALTTVSSRRLVKAMAFLLLAPPVHLMVMAGFPTATVVALALLVLIYAAAHEAWLSDGSDPTPGASRP